MWRESCSQVIYIFLCIGPLNLIDVESKAKNGIQNSVNWVDSTKRLVSGIHYDWKITCSLSHVLLLFVYPFSNNDVIGMTESGRRSTKNQLAAAARVSQFLIESKVPDDWYSMPRKLVLRKQVLDEVRKQVCLLEESFESSRECSVDAFADFRRSVEFVVVHSLNYLSDELHDLFGILERSIWLSSKESNGHFSLLSVERKNKVYIHIYVYKEMYRCVKFNKRV